MEILLKLFWAFFQIGLFSIGGGYAAMPLIQEQVIAQNQWMSIREFTDLITISQMTPGPIAINSASFIGAAWPVSPGRSFPLWAVSCLPVLSCPCWLICI